MLDLLDRRHSPVRNVEEPPVELAAILALVEHRDHGPTLPIG